MAKRDARRQLKKERSVKASGKKAKQEGTSCISVLDESDPTCKMEEHTSEATPPPTDHSNNAPKPDRACAKQERRSVPFLLRAVLAIVSLSLLIGLMSYYRSVIIGAFVVLALFIHGFLATKYLLSSDWQCGRQIALKRTGWLRLFKEKHPVLYSIARRSALGTIENIVAIAITLVSLSTGKEPAISINIASQSAPISNVTGNNNLVLQTQERKTIIAFNYYAKENPSVLEKPYIKGNPDDFVRVLQGVLARRPTMMNLDADDLTTAVICTMISQIIAESDKRNIESIDQLREIFLSYYISGNYDAAKGTAKRLLEVSKEDNTALYGKALIFAREGRTSESRAVLERMYSVAQDRKDKEAQCQAALGLGAWEIEWGSLKRSERYTSECLSLADELGNIILMGNALGNMGIIYERTNTKRASEYHTRSIELLLKGRDLIGVVTESRAYARFLLREGEVEKALRTCSDSLNCAVYLRNRYHEAASRIALAECYADRFLVQRKTNDLVAGKDMLRIGIEIAFRDNYIDLMSSAHYNLGVVCMLQGDYAAAKKNWEDSMLLYEKMGRKARVVSIRDCANALANNELLEPIPGTRLLSWKLRDTGG